MLYDIENSREKISICVTPDAALHTPRFVTPRTRKDGSVRYYFRRRGFGTARLYGRPGETSFEQQYEALLKASEPQANKPWPKSKARVVRKLAATFSPERRAAARLMRGVRTRSKISGLPRDIDAAWIERRLIAARGCCEVSGLPFVYDQVAATKDGRHPLSPSIDRMDSSRGYTKDNCRMVLLAVNLAMNQWGDSTFIAICEAVSRKCGERRVTV